MFISLNMRQVFITSKSWISVAKGRHSSNLTTKADDELIDFDEREAEINRIRNKSKLRSYHRNILFNSKPHPEPLIKSHFTVKYNRKMYGKYGSESGVNPGIMWPTKEDIQLRKEYEKVAFPYTIQEMVAMAIQDRENIEAAQRKNEDRVLENLGKLEKWKKDLKDKIAKKEADALAAKLKKEKLVEEVRRHFGVPVDPRDDKFKELLAQKEKEQKKKEKQARIDEKERKAIEKLMIKIEEDEKNNK